MATNQQKQALRNDRKKKGECIYCGLFVGIGIRECQECIRKRKRNVAIRVARKQGTNICKNDGCNRVVTGDHQYCDWCNNKSTARFIKNRNKAKVKGQCTHCKKVPAAPGLTRCHKCNEKMKEAGRKLVAARLAEGKCGSCGLYVFEAGYKYCHECIMKKRKWHADLKLEVIKAYGGAKCNGCDETEICVLQMDHINGGGHKHAKEIGGSGKLYPWLKHEFLRTGEWPKGFRVLCACCNIRAARGVPFPNQRSKVNN